MRHNAEQKLIKAVWDYFLTASVVRAEKILEAANQYSGSLLKRSLWSWRSKCLGSKREAKLLSSHLAKKRRRASSRILQAWNTRAANNEIKRKMKQLSLVYRREKLFKAFLRQMVLKRDKARLEGSARSLIAHNFLKRYFLKYRTSYILSRKATLNTRKLRYKMKRAVFAAWKTRTGRKLKERGAILGFAKKRSRRVKSVFLKIWGKFVELQREKLYFHIGILRKHEEKRAGKIFLRWKKFSLGRKRERRLIIQLREAQQLRYQKKILALFFQLSSKRIEKFQKALPLVSRNRLGRQQACFEKWLEYHSRKALKKKLAFAAERKRSVEMTGKAFLFWRRWSFKRTKKEKKLQKLLKIKKERLAGRLFDAWSKQTRMQVVRKRACILFRRSKAFQIVNRLFLSWKGVAKEARWEKEFLPLVERARVKMAFGRLLHRFQQKKQGRLLSKKQSEHAVAQYVFSLLRTAFASLVLNQKTKFYEKNLEKLGLLQEKRFAFRRFLAKAAPQAISRRKEKLCVKHYGVSLLFRSFRALKWSAQNFARKNELAALHLEKCRVEHVKLIFGSWKQACEQRGLGRMLKKRVLKQYQQGVKRNIFNTMRRSVVIRKRLTAYVHKAKKKREVSTRKCVVAALYDHAIQKKYYKGLNRSAQSFRSIKTLKKFFELWRLRQSIAENEKQKERLAMKSYALNLLQGVFSNWKGYSRICKNEKGRGALLDQYRQGSLIKKAFEGLKKNILRRKKFQIISLKNKAKLLKNYLGQIKFALKRQRKMRSFVAMLENKFVAGLKLFALARIRGRTSVKLGFRKILNLTKKHQLRRGFKAIVSESSLISRARSLIIHRNLKKLFISLHILKIHAMDQRQKKGRTAALRREVEHGFARRMLEICFNKIKYLLRRRQLKKISLFICQRRIKELAMKKLKIHARKQIIFQRQKALVNGRALCKFWNQWKTAVLVNDRCQGLRNYDNQVTKKRAFSAWRDALIIRRMVWPIVDKNNKRLMRLAMYGLAINRIHRSEKKTRCVMASENWNFCLKRRALQGLQRKALSNKSKRQINCYWSVKLKEKSFFGLAKNRLESIKSKRKLQLYKNRIKENPKIILILKRVLFYKKIKYLDAWKSFTVEQRKQSERKKLVQAFLWFRLLQKYWAHWKNFHLDKRSKVFAFGFYVRSALSRGFRGLKAQAKMSTRNRYSASSRKIRKEEELLQKVFKAWRSLVRTDQARRHLDFK